MRKIWTIIWKDTILRFSSASEILFFLILPIVFTILLGGGVGVNNNDDTSIPLLVINEDGGPLATELLTELSTSGTVSVTLHTLTDAEAALADEEAPALLVIPAGFSHSLLQGETADLSLRQLPNDTNTSGTAPVTRAIAAAISRVSQPLTAAQNSVREAERQQPFADDAARLAYFATSLALAQQLQAETPSRLHLTQPETANTQADTYDPAAQQSAGQLITWVFIPMLGTSAFLALERSRRTLRRLMSTPTSKATLLLGTITGQFLTGLVQMSLLVIFGIWVMGVNWGQSLSGLAVMLLSFALASVALGTMLGTFVTSESQAGNVSLMVGMVMALLGGCWWPLELFPPLVQTAVHALPTTWAMQGLTDMAQRGLGLTAVLPEAGVLMGFALLFFLVGIWRFRFE